MDKFAQNFISADFRFAKNSYDDYFEVGEIVINEDEDVGRAQIIGFGIDSVQNEIIAYTDKGWTHIDFIHHG